MHASRGACRFRPEHRLDRDRHHGDEHASYIAAVQISGVAVDNDAVANFLDTLAGMPGWGNVYLSNTSADPALRWCPFHHGEHHAGSPLAPLHEWELTDEVTRA